MAAHTQISVEEYLRTSFKPDRDYLDGKIVERNVGDDPHSNAQVNLVGFFYVLRNRLGLRIRSEIRMRLAPRLYRIADVAIFAGDKPPERVPSQPPLIAIEILSPDDRYSEVLAKLEDYRSWGVRHVWFVDPLLRKLHTYDATGLHEAAAFSVPEHDIEIPAAAIFE